MNKIKREQLPVIDFSKCIKCNDCYIICPVGAIVKESSAACAKCIKYCLSIKVPCNPEHNVFCYEKCDNCGLCVTECKSEAIYWYEIVLK